MQKHRLQTKLHWKTGSRVEVAVQSVTRTWKASTKSIGVENFETAYSLYFIYDRRTALLHVVMSHSASFSPVSLRTSGGGVGQPVKTSA